MSKVVYLLGAGASYGKRDDGFSRDNIVEGIPIVREFIEQLEYVISIYSDFDFKDNPIYTMSSIRINLIDAQKELLADLQWLIDNTKRHATVDTFAKKLFLTNHTDDYVKLKRLLSLFLMTEQFIHKPDSRYDTFLANVLQRNKNGKLRISEDITILTWNYDSQFEIAYKEYLYSDSNPEIIKFPEQLGIDIHNQEVGFIKPKTFVDDGARQIFKINGSASFVSEYSIAHYYEYSGGVLKENLAKSFLWTYHVPYHLNGEGLDPHLHCLLNFAWEKQKDEFDKHYYNRLNSAISDAMTLVVIGYTFPFFNREIDAKLLLNMPNLRNVYIQDPQANNVKQVFVTVMQKANQPISPDNIHTISDVEQFYLPAEL